MADFEVSASNIVINQAAYPMYTHQQLVEWCGFLPHWVVEFNILGRAGDDSLIDWMNDRYGFGDQRNRAMDGTIDDKGTYRYPNDPDLEFIARIETRLGYCYIYPYGIIAIPDGKDKPHLVTRMD